MKKPPIGSSWRILADGVNSFRRVDIRSADYPARKQETGAHRIDVKTVFDELVIEGVIHVEQMDARTWFVELGDEKRMVTVKRDGTVSVGKMYR